MKILKEKDMKLEVKYLNSGKFVFVDEEGKQHGGEFDDAKSFSEGYAAVRLGKKWFYLDDENFALHGGYDYAENFSEGYATVRENNSSYYVKAGNFDKLIGEDLDWAWGLQEGVGEILKNCKYYFVKLVNDELQVQSKGYDYVRAFNEGFGVGVIDGKAYLINKSFEEKGQGWDDAWSVFDGFSIVKDNGLNYFVSIKDFKRYGAGYDKVIRSFSDGVAVCREAGVKFKVNKKIEIVCDEEDDYFSLAGRAPRLIQDFPAEKFADKKFCLKIKNAVFKYFMQKIEMAEESNLCNAKFQEETSQEITNVLQLLKEKKEGKEKQIANKNQKEKFLEKLNDAFLNDEKE